MDGAEMTALTDSQVAVLQALAGRYPKEHPMTWAQLLGVHEVTVRRALEKEKN